MKALYFALLFSALGLYASAANNNASKIIRFNNKAVGSYQTQIYPTPDGGVYLFYEPHIVDDSVLITRLDENGTVQWSKKLNDQAGMARAAVTPDNGFVLMAQDISPQATSGYFIEKFSATGTLVYSYKVSPQGNTTFTFPSFEVATDGTVTVSFTGGTTSTYVFSPTGVQTVRILSPDNEAGYHPFVPVVATASGIQYTVTNSDGKPTLIKTNDTVVVYAKKYTIPGTLLGAFRIKQLHDGNLLLCGTNPAQDSAFVAKIEESTGQLLWAKRYDIFYGAITTTATLKTVLITLSSFSDVAELADGTLALAGVCKYQAFSPLSHQYDAVSLTRLNADGSAIASYYLGGDVEDVNDTSIAVHTGLRYGQFQTLFGDETEHYLSVCRYFPDSNNVTLLPISKVADACGTTTGTINVSNLLLAATDDVTVTAVHGLLPSTQLPDITDNVPDLTTTTLCLSGQNAATGINNLQGNTMQLMPNPANGNSTITVTLTDATGYQQLNLLDLTGRLLLNLQRVNNTNNITLPGLAKGSYIIQLTGTGKQTVTKQLLVTE